MADIRADIDLRRCGPRADNQPDLSITLALADDGSKPMPI